MRKVILPLLVLSALNFSCSKKDDSSGKTNAELIIGNWKLTGLTFSPAYDFDGDGSTETNAYAKMGSCEKDNVISFLAGGVWKNDEGPTKCSVADPQTLTGVWTLSSDDVTINIDGDIGLITFLNNSTLQISLVFSESGVTYTETFNFQRL